jgi:hypothetical protein
VHAGKHLHQRRLAGAIVADEGDDFTGLHIEINVRQCGYSAEILGYAAQAQH